MNYKEAQERGHDLAKKHLAVVEAAYGTTVAAAYAAGHAWAARDYIFDVKGARAAHDMCIELGEDALAPILPGGA